MPRPHRRDPRAVLSSGRAIRATLATIIAIGLVPATRLARAEPERGPAPRAAPSQILEACREMPLTTNPLAIAIRNRVNAALNAPIAPKAREALNRSLAKTEHRAGQLRRLKRIAGIDRDRRRLSLLARAHRLVQDERLAASHTTTEGDHEGVKCLNAQRIDTALERPSALSVDAWRALMGAINDGMRTTRIQATRNWKDADLMVRRWAARGTDLTLERIMRINAVLGAGMPARLTRPGLIRSAPGTDVSIAVDGKRMLFPASPDVPRSMAEFMDWYAAARRSCGPIELAGRAAQRLVSVHPFGDGNGRTARLVADWILQRHGLPPATFSISERNILAVFGQGVEASEKAKVIGAIKAVDRGVRRTLEIYGSQLGKKL